jgi:hypothetical protein
MENFKIKQIEHGYSKITINFVIVPDAGTFLNITSNLNIPIFENL